MDEDTADVPPKILFYDGVCGLCSKLVRVVVAADKNRVFRYAPLQGETAQALRVRHPELPADLATMAYLEDGRVHVRSQAIIRAAGQLGFPFRALYWFRWLPAGLTDLLYRLVARLRYRLFGRYDECRIPTPEERQLFLT
jgi:predicted DCC family thiol-disulfide oxidoreductase YuxK